MTRKKDRPETVTAKDMSGYKKKILPVNKGSLTLERDLYFIGTTQRGYEVEYDPKYEEGCSPTETLLLSVAGCLAIDVVTILRKMRCTVASFRVDVEGIRKLTPPQYYTDITLMIHVCGKDITPQKIERSIALSRDTYCSVYHSLRKDLKIDIRYEIE
ncbi:MAG: OsmC family protein [Desulfobacterales bacterium]|nr:OsmC family protein [Desulfobacterales bacterium]